MILLDTHSLIWWINKSSNLSKKAKNLIDKEANSGLIMVSSMSVWEIALLIKKERLQLSMDLNSWLAQIESLPFVKFVPVDNTIAIKSVFLPGKFHADPADRIIVATAREKGAKLITGDKKIRQYPHVQAVW